MKYSRRTRKSIRFMKVSALERLRYESFFKNSSVTIQTVRLIEVSALGRFRCTYKTAKSWREENHKNLFPREIFSLSIFFEINITYFTQMVLNRYLHFFIEILAHTR